MRGNGEDSLLSSILGCGVLGQNLLLQFSVYCRCTSGQSCSRKKTACSWPCGLKMGLVFGRAGSSTQPSRSPVFLFSPMHEDAAARSAQRVLSSGSHTGVDIWPVGQNNWSQEVGIQWQKHHPQMMKAWAECCRNLRGAGQTAGLMREGPIARPSWKTLKIPVAHCPIGQDRGPMLYL